MAQNMSTLSVDVVDREIFPARPLAGAAGIAVFIMLMAIGAYVRIPLSFAPVPITLQTFFVLLAGAMLGPRRGLYSQAGYVALGAVGLPIFQSYGAGAAYLFGPLGGYSIGFMVSAFLVGSLIRQNKLSVPFSMFIGLLTIYLCGAAWLAIAFKMRFVQAAYLGVLPFIPGALVKLIGAAWVYSKIKKYSLS